MHELILSRAILAVAGVLASLVPALAQGQTTIRIGWQPTTTVEAQIAHTLARTDILERNGLKGEPTMFSFGPAVNEALISGAVDVGFIGDMPSISLLAAGAPVTIIARQSVFRGSIVASARSDIKSLGDLRGKKIYGPYGSSIYRSALNMLKDAGLEPGRTVEVINMGFAEIADALRAGNVDAVFVWDPWVELFVREGIGRELKSDASLTMVVAMRDAFIRANPDGVERFLKSHKEALLFAALNRTKANEWFRQPEAARRLEPAIIETATAYDPAWQAKSLADIRLTFTSAELDRYKDVAKFAHDLKITPILSPVEAKSDLATARRLDAAPWPFDPAKVAVR
jgi:sulfonate transport system substrate-binding protein